MRRFILRIIYNTYL